MAHHGSHDGTPLVKGLELMTSRELAAMLPVDRPTARRMDWNMPYPELYRRLVEKTAGRVLDAELGSPTGSAHAEADNETIELIIDINNY